MNPNPPPAPPAPGTLAPSTSAPGTSAPGTSAPETSAPDSLAKLFAALGDPTRIGIVNALLQHAPQPISRLTQNTDLTRQAVTQHLRVLSAAGVVYSTRAGREQHYFLQPPALSAAQDYLQQVAAQWDTNLARLANFVEPPAY